MKTYRVEMLTGEDTRSLRADEWAQDDKWLIFYRQTPQGLREYWRVRIEQVVSLETAP